MAQPQRAIAIDLSDIRSERDLVVRLVTALRLPASGGGDWLVLTRALAASLGKRRLVLKGLRTLEERLPTAVRAPRRREPCIDSGSTLGTPATDREGDPRDESPDIGADEWTGAPSPCRGVDCSDHGV